MTRAKGSNLNPNPVKVGLQQTEVKNDFFWLIVASKKFKVEDFPSYNYCKVCI